MVVSNRNLLFQGSIFRCYVSFREGNHLVDVAMSFQASSAIGLVQMLFAAPGYPPQSAASYVGQRCPSFEISVGGERRKVFDFQLFLYLNDSR